MGVEDRVHSPAGLKQDLVAFGEGTDDEAATAVSVNIQKPFEELV